MTGDLHEAIREQLANDELDAHVREHLATCAACSTWQQRLALVRASVRQPVITEATEIHDARVDEITRSVLAADIAHRRRFLAGARTAAAAAVVVVVASVSIIASRQTAPDRLAAIADGYRVTGTRFVFEAEATVPVPEASAGATAPVVSLRHLPVCSTDATATSRPTASDLTDLVDELLASNPCAALAGLQDLDTRSRQLADMLAGQSASATRRASELAGVSTSSDPLLDASRYVAIDRLRLLASKTGDELDRLIAAHTAGVAGLTPLASAASGGQPVGAFQPAARDAIVALAAIVDQPAVDDDVRSIAWDLLSTGTWTEQTVTVTGTATAGDTALSFDNVLADPLALTPQLFADPETLLAVLGSAPATTGDVIEWTVPADVLAPLADTPYTATATLTAAGLDRLQLSAQRADGTTVVLTITPAR